MDDTFVNNTTPAAKLGKGGLLVNSAVGKNVDKSDGRGLLVDGQDRCKGQ
jgi:hypothetical protein